MFDPLGLVAPVTIVARLLLQTIWRRQGQDWDTPLPADIADEFRKWLDGLHLLGEIKLQRPYFAFAPVDQQLHVFGDASLDAFGAVAFLRARHEDGAWHSSFVIGKARAATMKVLTIPKLELQASLLASRLFQQLKVELSCAIEAVYMWSDSKTVVQLLRSSDKKHPVFVANRLSEILEHTTVDQWHHVPGELNPADCATRDCPPTSC